MLSLVPVFVRHSHFLHSLYSCSPALKCSLLEVLLISLCSLFNRYQFRVFIVIGLVGLATLALNSSHYIYRFSNEMKV